MQLRKSIFISLVSVCLLGLVSPAWSYEEMQVANGGAIKGKVTYTGSVPTRKIIPTKDQEVCGGSRRANGGTSRKRRPPSTTASAISNPTCK